jgi:prophage tail gpP-like protein
LSLDLDIHLTDLGTGKVNRITHFTEYSVVEDLMNPASNFSATLAAVNPQRGFTAHGGQKAQVFFNGALQATSITDERSEATAASNTDLQITGRGVGRFLIDNVVDSKALSMTDRTLAQVAQRITEPYQPDFITSVVTDNAANRYMVAGKNPSYASKTKSKVVWLGADGKPNASNTNQGYGFSNVKSTTKVRVKGSKQKFGKASPFYRGTTTDNLKQTRISPEERISDVLGKLCKQIATHWWVGADGALIIARPTYDFDSTVYGEGIVQKWDRKVGRATGGNVMQSQFETSIATRHPQIVAWATGKPSKTSMGKALLKHVWSVKDPSPAFWQRLAGPKLGRQILPGEDRKVFKSIRNEKLIRRVCRGIFEERVIAAFSLEYQIAGHTINGAMPVCDSMINVHDERYGLVGTPYYITRVERKLNMDGGRVTMIKLIPPKIWLHFDHDSVGDAEYEEHMIQRVFW